MTFKVSFSPRARLDMAESVAYIHTRSPQSAGRWYYELKVLQKSLEVSPSRFPQLDSSRLAATPYRVALHYSHKVIFRVDEQAKAVIIVRVYHSARKPFEFERDIEVK
ncbi:MAG: type II toxin-antitoxin system RelE/ParE family toxin [Abditibacteriaceae bacterium]